MFLLSKSLQNFSDTHTIPYSLDVDIVKDCSNLRHEMNDILNVIDRTSNAYVDLIRKVNTLQHF